MMVKMENGGGDLGDGKSSCTCHVNSFLLVLVVTVMEVTSF